jgi:hypothetical protein
MSGEKSWSDAPRWCCDGGLSDALRVRLRRPTKATYCHFSPIDGLKRVPRKPPNVAERPYGSMQSDARKRPSEATSRHTRTPPPLPSDSPCVHDVRSWLSTRSFLRRRDAWTRACASALASATNTSGVPGLSAQTGLDATSMVLSGGDIKESRRYSCVLELLMKLAR